MVVDNLEKQSGRIEVINVLRGVTLFEIILVHMTQQYYAGQAPEQFANFVSKGLIDGIVTDVTQDLVFDEI